MNRVFKVRATSLSFLLATVSCLGFSSGAIGANLHSTLCLFGCPQGGYDTNNLIVRDALVSSNNPQTKLPDWVVYRISPEMIGVKPLSQHAPDPFLADHETLEPADYNNSLPLQPGQFAPGEAYINSPAYLETTYSSNIAPMAFNLESGVWRKLAQAELKLAQSGQRLVYAVGGPLYEQPIPLLPNADEPHLVPSSYWKLIATFERGIISHEAFIFHQNTERDASFCSYVVRVDELEARTGLTFFPALDRNVQAELKSKAYVLSPTMGCPKQ